MYKRQLHASGAAATFRLTDTANAGTANTLSIFRSGNNLFGIGVSDASTNTNSLLIAGLTGNVGIGVPAPDITTGQGNSLHVGGSTLRLGQSRTPASSSSAGLTGEICWDSSFLYVCIALNTWRRIALTTW